MGTVVNCLVCGNPNIQKTEMHYPERVFYKCPTCGHYELSETEKMNPSLDMNKLGSFFYYKGFRRSFGEVTKHRYYTTMPKEWCDQYTENNKEGYSSHAHPVHLSNEIIETWYPKSFAEKIDKIMIKLDELSGYVGQVIELTNEELFGLMFVEKYDQNNKKLSEQILFDQAYFYIQYLKDIRFIEGGSSISEDVGAAISITPEGYKRIDDLQRNIGEGRKALVAMKFGKETTELRDSIKQGIQDAGYNPILIDEVEHNGQITPELLKQIKQSRFVVVDLTHKNNGAYFEEGYAMGLGKTVIQLCKKRVRLHFDVAQKNTIIWERESDIPLKLKNRIKATID